MNVIEIFHQTSVDRNLVDYLGTLIDLVHIPSTLFILECLTLAC